MSILEEAEKRVADDELRAELRERGYCGQTVEQALENLLKCRDELGAANITLGALRSYKGSIELRDASSFIHNPLGAELLDKEISRAESLVINAGAKWEAAEDALAATREARDKGL